MKSYEEDEEYQESDRVGCFIPTVILCAIIMALTLFSVQGCKTIEYIPIENTIEKEVIITERDTIIGTLPDSVSMGLLFECDSNNNVVVEELYKQNGRIVSMSYSIRELSSENKFLNNESMHQKGLLIDFHSEIDSLNHEIKVRDTLIKEHNNRVELREVERDFTWWEQTKMKGFWALLIINILFLLIKILWSRIRLFF